MNVSQIKAKEKLVLVLIYDLENLYPAHENSVFQITN